MFPETLYEKRRKLEIAIRHDKKLFKILCVIAAVVLCLFVPIFICWFYSKIR